MITGALDRLHAALESGNRPSPARFNDAVREIDTWIAALLMPLDGDTAHYARRLIEMRSLTVSLRDTYDASEDTARHVIDRVAQHLATHVQVEVKVPDPVRCDRCERIPSRYIRVAGLVYCMRCADEAGVRPTGAI